MKFIDDNVYRTLIALFVACSISSVASAAQGVIVKDAWVRATAPGQNTAGVYLDIASNAEAALVGAVSPVANSAEMHAMRMEGGVMKMRALQRIELPAQKTVKLAPGGLHIMLVGIKQPLREKQRIPLELTIEGAGRVKSNVKVEAEVRSLTATGEPHAH